MGQGNFRRPAYFIGLALPFEHEKRLTALKWQLYEENDHALTPLVPHITLLHPPSLSDIEQEDVILKIRSILSDYLPLRISLETVESFGHTVLYIRVRSPELEALQSHLVQFLPPTRQELYRVRGYIPHVTLAQVKEPYALDIDILRHRIESEPFLPIEISVKAISIFTQLRPRVYSAKTIQPIA